MEIFIKAEQLGSIGTFPITNTIVASTIVVLFLCLVAFIIWKTKYDLKSKFYNFVEMLLEGFMSVIESIVGRGIVAKQIFGVIVTFFLFIILNNWFGIFPGMGSIGFWEKHAEPAGIEATHTTTTVENKAGELVSETKPEAVVANEKTSSNAAEVAPEKEAEPTFIPLLRSANSDLNMTLAIALMSVFFIQAIAIKNLGVKTYLGKFFNFSNPIFFFIGILELISEVIKIFSFSFRLFGNIFAGDVLLIVIFSLVPYVAPLPFMAIEMFAGFIQALVFAMLTMVFVKSAVSHGEH
jgi:F-type H+-transporting ATPase subunit a